MSLERVVSRRTVAETLVIAAVCAIGGTFVVRTPVDPVIAASAEIGYRPTVARLSSWSAYLPPPRPTAQTDDLRVRAAIASLERNVQNPHTTGVARLLRGDSNGAVEVLRDAAPRGNDSATWNDLAAAFLERASKTDDAQLNVDALAATDRALTNDPRFSPAMFNRALALTALGLRASARHAWNDYLAVDRASGWAGEALTRLHDLGGTTDADEWTRVFAGLERARGADLTARVRDAVERYPQFARRWGENTVLSHWAVNYLARNDDKASQDLDLARRIGERLVQHSRETFLRDSVAAVDRSIGSGRSAAMAEAYVAYRDARLAHRDKRPSDAERGFSATARQFALLGSPMAYVARYYEASAIRAQLRTPEAAKILDQLADEHLERRGYRAASAQIGWERGASLMERSAISDAISCYSASSRAFEALGEYDFAATMNAFLADALALVGDSRGSWNARAAALSQLSRSGNEERTVFAVSAGAAYATVAKEWSRAEALLDLVVASATRIHDIPVAAHAVTQRAIARAEGGNARGARSDVAAAEQLIAQLPDPAMRARAGAELSFAEGMLARNERPSIAVAKFHAAATYFAEKNRGIDLPRVELELGRVESRLGTLSEATRDLDTGIAAVESERSSLRDLSLRTSLLSAAEELYEEAIDLAVRTGDGERAFDLTERHRARALTEMFELGDVGRRHIEPLRLAEVRQRLAPGTTILEYDVLPHRLVTLVIRRDEFRVASTEISRTDAVSRLSRFRTAVHEKQTNILTAAADADALLLSNVRADLAGSSRIAFIIDHHLGNIPFAALYDAIMKRFLIENTAIVAAPSATLLIDASRQSTVAAAPSVLSVGANVFDGKRYPDLLPLENAKDEAAEVAGRYRRSVLLTGASATVGAVRAAAVQADVIHFAGHALTSRRAAESALLVAPSADNGGEWLLPEIAALRMRRPKLVVLAACKSAKTPARDDGPENLALAFIAAGSPTVIATVSDLDDQVAKGMMTNIHAAISSGADAAAAVRSAVVPEIRDENGNVRRRFDWSEIVVVGGCAPIVQQEKGRTP